MNEKDKQEFMDLANQIINDAEFLDDPFHKYCVIEQYSQILREIENLPSEQ